VHVLYGVRAAAGLALLLASAKLARVLMHPSRESAASEK
jgi:hypothetical protein